ncbi:hypothetical protein GOP47_0025266 [Adiantum capillus-veneris]|uniref:TraB domain-containing protein n=1 Tax=Adiantum capillus-veneris TaxID=13818 RepID=A0A9D4U0Q8_ADICA|nr:hypothetical protein GOP47_0025266 [Adiantum capillus-veneris]
MDSSDGGDCKLDSHVGNPVALPLAREIYPSSSSEALEESSKLSSACEQAGSCHTPSADGSSCVFLASHDRPLEDLSRPCPEQCLPDLGSSLTMASLSIEQAHCSSVEASSLHLADVAPTEQLWQEPCTQRAPSLSEGDCCLEEPLSSSSASQLSDGVILEEEDSPCNVQGPELSDDDKREMITEICKGVSVLSFRSEALGGSCYVYLVGTAHVSEESCREVQAAVQFLKPQVVFLELCQKRTSVLQRTPFVVPTVSDMISTWKQRKTNLLGIVYSWFLAKVAAKLDVRPGAEFRAAYEEALACGAKVILGDRDIEVTLRRTWGKMSAWYKTKFIFVLLYQSIFLPKADQLNELIEKLKDADILTIAFEELGKFSPTLMETVITERDLFMTAALQKIAEHHSSIVAVVGRGHVAGITKYWGQDIPIHTLLEIPQKRSLLGLRLRTYMLIILVAFASVILYALH